MLIYSDDRFVPTDINMMVISDGGGGYFYIHRSLYDQAVILYDIYGEDPVMLIRALTGQDESRPDVDFFLESMPVPINIFGPYLLLVTDEIEDPEDMLGAIHVMSGPVNLRRMLKVPFEMRNTPSFSLSIREEYKLAWNRFFQTALPYSDDMFNSNYGGPMNGTQTFAEDDESLEEDLDDAFAFALDCGPDPFGLLGNKEDENEKEAEAAPVMEPEPAPAEPEPEPAEPEPPKKLSGLEALLGGTV